MATLVQVQTLRGTAGIEAAQNVVSAAVNKFNATAGNTPHVVSFFEALKPNTKGMQIQLSVLAVLARNHGATLIRLSVHNGQVALCGEQADVDATLDAWMPTYNRMVTVATSVYTPGQHGPRMGFINGFVCGMCAALDANPAELAYGVGTLFSFPKPGNGNAYDLGALAIAEEAKADAPNAVKPAAKRTRKVA